MLVYLRIIKMINRATEFYSYSEVNYMNLDKKTLEGIIADTSTAENEADLEEEKEEVGLNNTTVPTPEEEQNANIEPQGDTLTPESGSEDEIGPDSNSDLIGDSTEPEPEPETDPELEAENETVVDPEGVSEATATKTFTQSQVDEIAGKVRKETREKTIRDIYSRYGVNTADELDGLMADAQRFATSKDDFAEKERLWNEQNAARDQELVSVKERVALLESGIDQNRFEDARLILRGKGLEVTAENIATELATHPEWKKQEIVPSPVEEAGLPFTKNPNPSNIPSQPEGPITKISIPTLGNNSSDNPQPELSERERALRMFKV